MQQQNAMCLSKNKMQFPSIFCRNSRKKPDSCHRKLMTHAEVNAFETRCTFVSEGRIAYASHIQPKSFLLWLNDWLEMARCCLTTGHFFSWCLIFNRFSVERHLAISLSLSYICPDAKSHWFYQPIALQFLCGDQSSLPDLDNLFWWKRPDYPCFQQNWVDEYRAWNPVLSG